MVPSTSHSDHSNNADLLEDIVGIDALEVLRTHSPGVTLPPLSAEATGSAATSSRRHEVNPAIALNLIKDIQTLTLSWQEQLRQVVQSIHLLHTQGPMINGWLESSLEAPGSGASGCTPESALFRHGDTQALMRYVESLTHGDSGDQLQVKPSSQAAQYRLCFLDDHGQVCSQICPPEQMATVSTAIARYQKYRQLMGQKQYLEAKLQQTVDELTSVRAKLQL